MAGAFRFDTYPRDWITGTRGLTLEGRAVYWDICCLIYEHGGPIPYDEEELRRILAISRVTKLRSLIDYLVQKRKLWVVDGYVGNDRAILELSKRTDFTTTFAAGKFDETAVKSEISRVLTSRKRRERKADSGNSKQLPLELPVSPARASPSPSPSPSQESYRAESGSARVTPQPAEGQAPRARITSPLSKGLQETLDRLGKTIAEKEAAGG